MKFKINNLYVIENLCRENKHIFNKCYKLKKIWSDIKSMDIQWGC